MPDFSFRMFQFCITLTATSCCSPACLFNLCIFLIVVSFRGCTQFRLDLSKQPQRLNYDLSIPFNLKIYVLFPPPFPSFSSEKYHFIAKKNVIVCVKGRANT